MDVIWLLNLKIILIKSLKCIQSAVLNGRDINEEEFSLQKEEVDSVLWMDLDECMASVEKNLIKHCIYFKELEMVKENTSWFL